MSNRDTVTASMIDDDTLSKLVVILSDDIVKYATDKLFTLSRGILIGKGENVEDNVDELLEEQAFYGAILLASLDLVRDNLIPREETH